MSLTRCFDAAYPPAFVPAGAGAVLGYISRIDEDNYHTWTPAEWLPFKGIRQFPVAELLISDDPRQSAQAHVAAMRALGWNTGRALVGAMETYIDPRWWHLYEQQVIDLGQWPVCYGSVSTVYRNHPLRVWEAHYDGIPEIPAPPTPAVAKQYLSSGSMDWSVLSTELLVRGGEGPRRQP